MSKRTFLFTVWICKRCDTFWGIEEAIASCDVNRAYCPLCGEEHEYIENVGCYGEVPDYIDTDKRSVIVKKYRPIL